MNTTAMLLGLFGLMITVGCSGADDPDPASEAPTALQCGSAELFSLTHDACGAMDAQGAPGDDGIECRCFLGYAWNGAECTGVSGCQCVGDDCDKLTETQEACEQVHAVCNDHPTTLHCGSAELFSLAHDRCEAMDAVAAPDEAGSCNCMLGFAWNGSSCEALADCQCVGEDCDKLTQSVEECEQVHAGCSAPQQLHCGSPELISLTHQSCDGMDARAIPDTNGQSCYCFLGYVWNGSSCESLADCACEGADCDKLAQTVEECEQAHAACRG